MTLNEIRELFKDFQGREAMLRGITRYSVYHTMFYRSTLWSHSQQVAWVVTSIAPVAKRAFGDRFDTRKAQLMALVHDDLEIIMGDVQLGNKTKMTPEQLRALEEQEQQAIRAITQQFPESIGGYIYNDLLSAYQRIDGLEATIVKYADKFCGFGESLHEAFGGNELFTVEIENEYGRIPTAYAIYIPYLRTFRERYPDIAPMFDGLLPLLEKPDMIDFSGVAVTRKPHTVSSLLNDSSYRPYKCWKQVIRAFADEEEWSNLYTQKEFPKPLAS